MTTPTSVRQLQTPGLPKTLTALAGLTASAVSNELGVGCPLGFQDYVRVNRIAPATPRLIEVKASRNLSVPSVSISNVNGADVGNGNAFLARIIKRMTNAAGVGVGNGRAGYFGPNDYSAEMTYDPSSSLMEIPIPSGAVFNEDTIIYVDIKEVCASSLFNYGLIEVKSSRDYINRIAYVGLGEGSFSKAEGTVHFDAGVNVQASGSFDFGANPDAGDKIVLGGITFTFVTGASDVDNRYIAVGPTGLATAQNALNVLVDSELFPNIQFDLVGQVVTMESTRYGSIDNAVTTTSSGSGSEPVPGGATFAGGVDDTITLNGTVWTFVGAGAAGAQTNRTLGTLADVIDDLVDDLNASADVEVAKCTYSRTGDYLNVKYKTAGAGGNAFTLAASNATVSAGTLLGGNTLDTPKFDIAVLNP